MVVSLEWLEVLWASVASAGELQRCCCCKVDSQRDLKESREGGRGERCALGDQPMLALFDLSAYNSRTFEKAAFWHQSGVGTDRQVCHRVKNSDRLR